MASISATILKHHKKQNGTWAVKYRITHQGKSVYLDTNFVAKKEDLDTKLRLKKIFIDRYLSIELNKLRDKVNSLGVRLALMSVANVKTFLTKAEQGPLDFFEYSLEYLERIKHRENSYKQRISSLQRLKEFVGGDVLSPFDFKVKFLEEFQDFLKIPLRSDAIKRGGRSNQTIANTIRDIKVIFDTMKLKYNDYDNGIILIPNDPFKLYKPVVIKKSRNRNLDIKNLKNLRDIELMYEADKFSRDIFMLSFYLCGMNAVDIFKYINESVVGVDRIAYNRTKTEGKRKDGAFISVKVVPEAKLLIEKYAGLIQKKYKSVKTKVEITTQGNYIERPKINDDSKLEQLINL